MTGSIDLYFLGGSAHGRRMVIPDNMAHVELPAMDAPKPWSPGTSLDYTATLRLDLYRVQRATLTVEHPCVPHAAYARVYRVAVWDRMAPGVQPPVRELLATRCDSEHRGRLDGGGVPPDWWWWQHWSDPEPVAPGPRVAGWAPRNGWAVML